MSDIAFATDPALFTVECVLQERETTTNAWNEEVETAWLDTYGPFLAAVRHNRNRSSEFEEDDKIEARASHTIVSWYDDSFTPTERMRIRLVQTEEIFNIVNYEDVDRENVFWRFECRQEKRGQV